MRWAEAVAPSPAPSPAFGVVGLGRMARALLEPLLAAGEFAPERVLAVVASDASARRLSAELPFPVLGGAANGASEVWRAPVVLLAVKPQQLEAVASSAATAPTPTPSAPGDPLLISVLAGVRLERLERLFPLRRCVRAVPNTPALVGAGLTALAWGAGVDPAQREPVQRLFARVGEVLELPEPQLDAFLALTSSGPAFLALVVEAMADGAVAAGLPRDLAAHLAHRTLAGTAALLRERELHPGQLKDMVASPLGTTIAGLRELERASVRSALLEAVLAAAERSRALA